MGLHIGWLIHATLSLIGVLAAFLVPAFYSFKALEAHQQNVEQWLTYWLVLGVWTTFEALLAIIVRRIPFFQLVKLGFVLWLQLPQTQGARLVYMKLILPALKQHEKVIDQYVELGESKVRRSLAHLGITSQHGAASTSDTFPSPGRLESLTQTVNRFGGQGGGSTSPSPDVESRTNVAKSS